MAAPQQAPVSPRIRLCRWLLRALLYLWGTLIVGIVVGTIANLNATPMEPGASLRTVFSHLVVGHLFLTYPVPIALCGILLILITMRSSR